MASDAWGDEVVNCAIAKDDWGDDVCSCSPSSKTRVTSWRVMRAQRQLLEEPGPSTIAELFDWPTAAVKGSLCHGSEEVCNKARDNLMCNLKDGYEQYGDYSGIEFAREAIECSANVLHEVVGIAIPPDGLRFSRSCDIS